MSNAAGPHMRRPHYDPSLLAGTSSRVRVQIFPLLADIGRLQTLCDKLFNDVVPRSVAIFRPALPMVFLGSLHYPEMSGALPYVTGTMTQNELYFLVPLERYREVNGREELVELCAATPYIFVDNAESAATGRERLGLPKEMATFSGPQDQGIPDIDGQLLLEVRSWEPGPTGHQLVPLLEILDVTRPAIQLGERDLERPASALDGVGPLAWLKLVDALKASTAHLGVETTQGVLRRLQTYAQLLAGSRKLNLYAVRQFPDPENPNRARYQDLVQFRMNVSDVQSVGFLGNGPLASQYRVVLRQTEMRPIQRVLGLRVDQRTQLGPGDDTFDVAAAIAPLAAQVDVDFVSADRLCWRSAPNGTAAWHDLKGDPISAVAHPRSITFLGPTSAAFLRSQQPVDIPFLDLKYLLLPASRASLQKHVNSLFPRHSGIRATLAGSGDIAAVRLLASRSRQRPRGNDGLAWTDGYYVSVTAPAMVDTPRGSFAANLIFHSYTTNGFMVQSLREMLAEPVEDAAITSGDAGWFGSTHPFDPILHVSTLDITRTASRASVGFLPLLDVIAARGEDARALLPGWNEAALRGFRDQAWPLMSRILPTVSVGSIMWPETARGTLMQRVTRLDFTTDEAPPVPRAEEGPTYLVRVHEHETQKLATELGLMTLPMDPSSDGGVVVPVLGFGEGRARIPLQSFDVLWESNPLKGGG